MIFNALSLEQVVRLTAALFRIHVLGSQPFCVGVPLLFGRLVDANV